MQRTKPPTSLDWDDVKLFLALTRARTVGAAGTQLGVDASTVSRRLAGLETALGVTLFDRGRSGIAMTQAAEALVPAAEEIEERMTQLVGAAEGHERAASGLVRVACPPDVAEVIIAPLLPTLRARHPGVRLEISPGEAVVDLSRREADLALRTVKPTRGDLVVTHFAETRWVLAASTKLAAKVGTLKRWDAAPWIGWGERLAHLDAARWLAATAPDVDPVVRTDSSTLQIALVRAGVGIALVPDQSLVHFGLVPVKLAAALRPATAAWPKSQLHLVTHAALRNVARVRVVWELLLEAKAHRAKSGVSAGGARSR